MTATDRGKLLRNLIREFCDGAIPAGAFCKQFEIAFNNEGRPEDFSDHEWQIFSKLFDTIAWYSPYPAERKLIPNYIDEQVVFDAAGEAASSLHLN